MRFGSKTEIPDEFSRFVAVAVLVSALIHHGLRWPIELRLGKGALSCVWGLALVVQTVTSPQWLASGKLLEEIAERLPTVFKIIAIAHPLLPPPGACGPPEAKR